MAVFTLAGPAQAACPGCEAVEKKGAGFCCGKGLAFGVKLTSQKLYDSVAGEEIDADAIKCPGCKSAHKENGKCSHCRVAMADGKMYRSEYSHTLAKGKPVSADEAGHCGGCKTAHTENGYCTGCGVGFVAGRMYKGQESFEAASAAHETLETASAMAKKCVDCAVAMVTDGECPSCKVKFKKGEKIES